MISSLWIHKNIESCRSGSQMSTTRLSHTAKSKCREIHSPLPLPCRRKQSVEYWMPRRQLYSINWRSHPGTTNTVFCEIFVQGKKIRVATHFMEKDKPETQSPFSIEACICRIKIRRAQGTPIHECRPDPEDPSGGHIDEIDLDLIDDANEGKDPFIIFRIEFVPASKQERNTAAGPLTVH
ncbi:hypothetical protein C8R47DRAFT_800456 [Mycena vitilis]|nr:hypothetical protein C8R47DRAFT_800456 [Mycena vitilis]